MNESWPNQLLLVVLVDNFSNLRKDQLQLLHAVHFEWETTKTNPKAICQSTSKTSSWGWFILKLFSSVKKTLLLKSTLLIGTSYQFVWQRISATQLIGWLGWGWQNTYEAHYLYPKCSSISKHASLQGILLLGDNNQFSLYEDLWAEPGNNIKSTLFFHSKQSLLKCVKALFNHFAAKKNQLIEHNSS